MRSSRAALAVGQISTRHFLTASVLCFLSCFYSGRKRERERESIWAKIVSLSNKYEIIYYVISGITMHSVSLVFSFGHLTAIEVIPLLFLITKMKRWSTNFINSPSFQRPFAASVATVCLWSKINQISIASVCQAHRHEKMFQENSALNFQSIRPWNVWAVTEILQQLQSFQKLVEMEDAARNSLQSDIWPLKLSSENYVSSSHVPVLRKDWHNTSLHLDSPIRESPLVVSMLDAFWCLGRKATSSITKVDTLFLTRPLFHSVL